jgi:hypothetical protein
MTIDFSADLDIFLADFGVSCSYIDNIGVPHSLTAVRLSDQEVFERGLGDLLIEGSAPVLQCKASDVSGLVRDNTFIWGGVYYRAVQVMPDPGCSDGLLSVVILANEYL